MIRAQHLGPAMLQKSPASLPIENVEFSRFCATAPQQTMYSGSIVASWPSRYRGNSAHVIGGRRAVIRRAALQDVADVNVFALQPAGDDDVVQELTCPADERFALGVFVGPGRVRR